MCCGDASETQTTGLWVLSPAVCGFPWVGRKYYAPRQRIWLGAARMGGAKREAYRILAMASRVTMVSNKT